MTKHHLEAHHKDLELKILSSAHKIVPKTATFFFTLSELYFKLTWVLTNEFIELVAEQQTTKFLQIPSQHSGLDHCYFCCALIIFLSKFILSKDSTHQL